MTDRDGGLLVATDEGSWRALRSCSDIIYDAEQSFGEVADFGETISIALPGSRSLGFD
jgi:hypothetical protein